MIQEDIQGHFRVFYKNTCSIFQLPLPTLPPHSKAIMVSVFRLPMQTDKILEHSQSVMLCPDFQISYEPICFQLTNLSAGILQISQLQARAAPAGSDMNTHSLHFFRPRGDMEKCWLELKIAK